MFSQTLAVVYLKMQISVQTLGANKSISAKTKIHFAMTGSYVRVVINLRIARGGNNVDEAST